MTTNEPPWLTVAKQEMALNISEVPGPLANPKILEYFKSVALPVSLQNSDEVSWCAAFINFCLIKSGYLGTHSPAARSFLNWGKVLTKPQLGCIVISSRGDSAWQGHVNFWAGPEIITGMIPQNYSGLGGNQHDSVNISIFPTSRVLGYRWVSI